MNEFDLQLESELRLFLDPITAAPAPPRRGGRIPEAPKVELRVVASEWLAVAPIETS
ncbi:MAG TPA: hypothetical protein VND96_05560 [Candidatus Micrarchaeaceae archaeon]|nr:hypothetical protein [Candidatus Micrarchaeaceae archaeon]